MDLRGPKLLCYNQIVLGIIIIAYCAWTLIAELTGPGTYAQTIQQNPELADILGPTEGLIKLIVAVAYGSIIVLTIPYQGFMAWYYLSRTKHIQNYLNQTPQWVTELERAAA
jgi:hypothetical protein